MKVNELIRMLQTIAPDADVFFEPDAQGKAMAVEAVSVDERRFAVFLGNRFGAYAATSVGAKPNVQLTDLEQLIQAGVSARRRANEILFSTKP